MEVKEAEKIVIAKPVPSRPTRSNFKSFSDLLTSAINASPSNPCHEAPVTAIRPRTVRFKPPVNHALVGVVSPEVMILLLFNYFSSSYRMFSYVVRSCFSQSYPGMLSTVHLRMS